MEAPASYEEMAQVLHDCAADGRSLRVRGGGTKLAWGARVEPDVEVATTALDRVLEYDAGDLTAVLQAGVRLADAQEQFAADDLELALDPPPTDAATIGGVVASGDSGPLRHRFGAPRDLVLGVRVALTDGSVARAGGKVIKNVAGYDLAKLFSGSFGTLGAIVEVSVRLHPKRPTASAAFVGADADSVAAAARRLTHARHDAHAIDVSWRGGRGGVLARYAGDEAVAQAKAAAREVGGDVVEHDEEAWAEQRAGQRGEVVVRVSTVQSRLADVFRAADAVDGWVVGRAALGLLWVRLPGDAEAAQVRALREALEPSPCALLDAPAALRAEVEPWQVGEAELMQRVKRRFDPAGVLV